MAIHTPWAAWEANAKICDEGQLKFIIADCRKAQQAMQGHNPEKEGFYSDQAATYSDELRKRKVVLA